MSMPEEMSLYEMCAHLRHDHRVHKELMDIRCAIGLLNIMICCGDHHSDTSMKTVERIMRILNGTTQVEKVPYGVEVGLCGTCKVKESFSHDVVYLCHKCHKYIEAVKNGFFD